MMMADWTKPCALTAGCFDMLHEGHVNLLKRMREHGTAIVLLLDDMAIFRAKGRFPVQEYEHRRHNLILAGADTVIPLHLADPSERIVFLVHNVSPPATLWRFFRGDDWPDFPGRVVLKRLGVPVTLVPYTQGVSSSMRRGEL